MRWLRVPWSPVDVPFWNIKSDLRILNSSLVSWNIKSGGKKRRVGSEWSTVIEGWSPLITCNSKMGVKNIAYLCSEHHELDETRSKSVKVQVDLMLESYWCHIELISNSYRSHIELISNSYRTHIGLISDANSENAGSVLSDPICSCSEV